MPANFLRPRSSRHAVLLLFSALLLFCAGILLARRQNAVALPVIALGVVAAVWGARRPLLRKPDSNPD